MSYTVTEATVVFPDKKATSSFSSGYASKKPCAHIDCELEGGFERSIWIPVRVARLFLKNRPELPCDWDEFREAVQLIERKCALTMVTEMLSRRDQPRAKSVTSSLVTDFANPQLISPSSVPLSFAF
ncbi:MAG: hypothetical protein ACLTHL_07805 [Collinsella sp.]